MKSKKKTKKTPKIPKKGAVAALRKHYYEMKTRPVEELGPINLLSGDEALKEELRRQNIEETFILSAFEPGKPGQILRISEGVTGSWVYPEAEDILLNKFKPNQVLAKTYFNPEEDEEGDRNNNITVIVLTVALIIFLLHYFK